MMKWTFFLPKQKNSLQNNFKAKNYDLEDYTNALFDRPEEDFMNENANYPIVIKKYQILKKIIEDLGVIFN